MSYTTITQVNTNLNHFASSEEHRAFITQLGLYDLAIQIAQPFIDRGQLLQSSTNVADNVVTVTRVWDDPLSSEQFAEQIAARQEELDQILSGLGWVWKHIQS